MFRVFAVLPAAGSGARMNVYPPKQFQIIEDKPVISHTIDHFEKLEWIEKVIVVTAVDEFDTMRKIVKNFQHSDKVVLVPGESTRHGSIYNGIKYMSSGHVDTPPDIVIVHDAVRMFLQEGDLNTIATEAFRQGAAGFIRPPVSTIITKSKDNYLDSVFDRTLCHASETPQAFKYEVIKEAYESASKSDIDKGTECLLLVKKYVLTSRVKLLEGKEHLWKITYQKDLYAAQGLSKEWNSQMVFVGPESVTWRNLLHAVTKSKDSVVADSCSRIPKSTIQNVILCHQTYNKSALNSDIKSAVGYFQTNCMQNCTIILIVATMDDDTNRSLRNLIKVTAENLKSASVVLYAISTYQEPLVNQIGKVISSLIKDRNCELSGQLFIY